MWRAAGPTPQTLTMGGSQAAAAPWAQKAPHSQWRPANLLPSAVTSSHLLLKQPSARKPTSLHVQADVLTINEGPCITACLLQVALDLTPREASKATTSSTSRLAYLLLTLKPPGTSVRHVGHLKVENAGSRASDT